MTIQELMEQIAEKARPAVAWCESELVRLAEEDEKDRSELADIDAMRAEVVERMERRKATAARTAADAEQVRRTLAAATRQVSPIETPVPLVPGPLSPLAHQALAASSSTQGLPVVELPITPQVTPPQGVPTVPAEGDAQDGGEDR